MGEHGEWSATLAREAEGELDLSNCPYYSGNGTCNRTPRCTTEPSCITDEPLEMWPSRRHLLDRDKLWAAAEGETEGSISVPVADYRKLVAAYDYWLVETGQYKVVVPHSHYCSECGELIEGADYDHRPTCSQFPAGL
jgi:hypothetical protein